MFWREKVSDNDKFEYFKFITDNFQFFTLSHEVVGMKLYKNIIDYCISSRINYSMKVTINDI